MSDPDQPYGTGERLDLEAIKKRLTSWYVENAEAFGLRVTKRLVGPYALCRHPETMRGLTDQSFTDFGRHARLAAHFGNLALFARRIMADIPLDLEPIKDRLLVNYGGGELWADQDECNDIAALIAEVERLRRASVSHPEPEQVQKLIAEMLAEAVKASEVADERREAGRQSDAMLHEGWCMGVREFAERLAGLCPSPGTQIDDRRT